MATATAHDELTPEKAFAKRIYLKRIEVRRKLIDQEVRVIVRQLSIHLVEGDYDRARACLENRIEELKSNPQESSNLVDLGLNGRLASILGAKGLLTVDHVVSAGYERIREIGGIGRDSLMELVVCLAARGVSLPGLPKVF